MKFAIGFGLGATCTSALWAWGIYRFTQHDLRKLGLALVKIEQGVE